MGIFEKVINIICEQLDISNKGMTLESTFESLDADSMDLVELVMAFEEEFDIEISDDEIEKIKTIGDVVDVIESLGKI